MSRNNKQNAAGAPSASPRRKLVLGLIVFGLAAMFLVSFIYRSQNQGLQVQRRAPEHGDAGQAATGQPGPEGMPAEMQNAMMADIGKMMQRMQENPDDVELLLELSDRFMAMKSWDRAEMFLNRAMVVEPANPRVLYNLGITAFQLERPADAAQYFEQLAAVDPAHAHAQFNLGMLYTHFLEQPEKGKVHFERVMEMETAAEDLKHAAADELGTTHDHGDEAGNGSPAPEGETPAAEPPAEGAGS